MVSMFWIKNMCPREEYLYISFLSDTNTSEKTITKYTETKSLATHKLCRIFVQKVKVF